MTEKENKINNLVTAIVGKVASLISTHNSDNNSHSDIRNAINNLSTSGPVTVEKQDEAEDGYVATYVIKQNGNQVGSKINIPKDFLVKSGTVETCVFLNQPVGCNVGDKYIDLVINTKANPETDEHIYIKVTDLIDTYEGDDAGTITITNNKIGLSTSIKNTINGKVNTSQGSANASKNVVTDASGNITTEAKPTIPTKVSQLTNDSGFLTSHQNISGKLDKAQGSSNASKNVVTDSSGNITTEAKPTIPTKTSQLTNDSNFTTATGHNHDSTYIKKTDSITSTQIADNTINVNKLNNYMPKSNNGSGTAGYIKVLNIKTNQTYLDDPITFEIYQRQLNKPILCSLKFTGSNNADPNVEKFTTYGSNNDVYLYKASQYNWQVIVKKIDNYDSVTIENINCNWGRWSAWVTNISNVFTHLDETITTLPSNTTTNPLIKATYSISNVLTDTDTDRSLSANQGKVLKGLIDGKASSTHTHGNITNAGAIGSTANLPVITTTSGKLTTGSFGTAANTFCQGNDSRLSNARIPVFTQIPASSSNTVDLNTYKTGGFYYVSSDVNMAQYVTNCPLSGTSNKSFFLLVETWGANSTYVKQTLTYYNTNATYTRTCSSNTWGSWSKLSQDGHTHNYAASSHTHTKSQITDFPTSMTPTSHTHGYLTNDGKLGSEAGKPVMTCTDGKICAGSFGTTAGTVCQGNDSRLSNARTPTSHSHGSIANGGTLNSDITSVNKVVVTDSSNNIKTISKLPASAVTHQSITGKADKSSIPNLAFHTGSTLGTGIVASPHAMTHSKNGYIYISCTDQNGNAMSGNLVISWNNGASVYSRTLSGGMASLQVTATGTYNIQVWYHNGGKFSASMMGRTTVS